MKVTKFIPSLVTLSVVAAATISRRTLSPNGDEFSSRAYDYVVIGGGTSGLAVAARLSEDPSVTVGVIEAGEYRPGDPLIETPERLGQLLGNATYDWLFKSTPQANANNRIINLPRGKVLGGSSAINFMVFDRASKFEYDAWADLGNPGWDWDGLLPYMKDAEHFINGDPFWDNFTHAGPDVIFPSQGTDGPVAAGYNKWYCDAVVPYVKDMLKTGIPANFDPDSGNAFGIFDSVTSVNRTTGKRSYAATTYYAYNAHRPNFVVLTGAQATKIEFKHNNGSKKLTSTGVSFVYDSKTFKVEAKREVILAAGAYQTPQLLELSGIGNPAILHKYGIEPLIDLPGVGENMIDHPLVPTTFELKPGITTFDTLRNNATFAAAAQAQYDTTHDGIYSSSNSILSFINLDSFTSPEIIANMTAQLDHEISLNNLTPLQKAQYTIQKGWLKDKKAHFEMIFNPAYYGSSTPQPNVSYISMVMAVQHPFSRGNIHINSSDPLVPPQIDLNFFSYTIDQEAFIHAIRFGLKVSKMEPLASMIVARREPPAEMSSDSELTNYVKNSLQTIYHPIGTAALAPKHLGGVVDTDLKVYGTSNLRVVDASIIPIHIASHLSRTVYGIAEKAAAIIKKSKRS